MDVLPAVCEATASALAVCASEVRRTLGPVVL